MEVKETGKIIAKIFVREENNICEGIEKNRRLGYLALDFDRNQIYGEANLCENEF